MLGDGPGPLFIRPTGRNGLTISPSRRPRRRWPRPFCALTARARN